ncbi:MAG: GntR family transcriptional regulator [Anaerolineae bacterium]|nr:GntR family transcriptional regulator [Anaerolineae bacterium]
MSISTTTYQQQAYDFVKRQIMNLGYRPGEYITDSLVAQALNISRTPVREAFHRLENEGLLINEARRGWKIYTLSLEDIHEIFDLKEVIEGLAARQAAACQDEQLRQALQDALARMKDAIAVGDSAGWMRADFELHDVLFEMAGNVRAQRIVQNLNDQWHRVRIGFLAMEGRIDRSVGEHEAFIVCILNGDGAGAERAMRMHLNQVRAELVRLLVNVVLPFVENGV